MKLYKLHFFDIAFGTVHHCYAITGSNGWIRCGGVHVSGTTGSHQGNFCQYGIDAVVVAIEHISAVTRNIGRAAVHVHAQVVLGNDFDGEMVFKNFYVFILAGTGQQGFFYFEASLVLMVKHPELRVAAFLGQVVLPGCVFVKIHPKCDQLLNTVGGFCNGDSHYIFIVQVVAGNQGVLYVFFIRVGGIHYGSYTSLGVLGSCFFSTGFGNYTHFSKLSCFQGKAKPGNTCSYNQEINFSSHISEISCKFNN